MSKHSLASFNPERVAMLDMQMWKAYYRHEFPKLMQLLIALFKEQFKVNSVVALWLGYHSMRAAMEFRKTGNKERTLKHLRKYYHLLNRHAIEDFDPSTAAKTELEWWIIHRYPSRGSLVQALANNMGVLYSLPAKDFIPYAQERAAGMELRDIATHKEKREPDWLEIQRHLGKSYTALSQAVNCLV